MDRIPPIEVYRVDGCHFVIDGHHRISIAAAAGERLIEANVTQLLTAAPSETWPLAGSRRGEGPRSGLLRLSQRGSTMIKMTYCLVGCQGVEP